MDADKSDQPAALPAEEIEDQPLVDGNAEFVDASDKPIAEQLSEIAADAKALVDTEIAYYRAKLDANLSASKRVVAYFGFGLAFGTAGLTAFVLGLLMTLAPYVGPGPATIIVAAGFCLLGGGLIAMAIKRARKLPLDSENDR